MKNVSSYRWKEIRIVIATVILLILIKIIFKVKIILNYFTNHLTLMYNIANSVPYLIKKSDQIEQRSDSKVIMNS